jgi:hypothetical protein
LKNIFEKIKVLFNFIDKNDWKFLGYLLCFLLLIAQFSTFVGILWDSAISRPVLMAYDEDSSYGVETSENTFLLNHNGSTTYGPIYYRLTWPIKHFFSHPNLYSEKDNSPNESRDRNIFFAMMMINLLASYGSAFILMGFLTHHFGWKIFGTLILVSVFLNNEMRSLLLFMAKPDYLVTFFVTLGMSLLVDFFKKNNLSTKISKLEQEKQNKKLACGWALALSTKLICIYFLPGFFIIFYNKIRKSESIKVFYNFIILVSIFYFLIGFPQNLDLQGYIKYLLQQNRHTSLVDWKFLTEQWIPLFSKDLFSPMLSIFLLTFIVAGDLNERTVSRENLLKLFAFVLIPIALVLMKQTTAPFQWYTFPFVNAFLAVFALLIKKVIQKGWAVLNTLNFNIEKFRVYKLIGVFLATPLVFNFFPDSVYQTYKSRLTCREDIYNVKKIIDEKLSNGNFVLADPGTPYDLKYHKQFIEPDWEISLDKLKAKDYKYVVLKGSYNATKTDEFYKLFHAAGASERLEFTDPFSKKWKQIYKDKCTYEIWAAK